MTDATFYNVLLFAWVVFAAVSFVLLFFVTAPYGRHNRSGWGWQIPSSIGWLVMESPAVIVFGLFFLFGKYSATAASMAFFLLWEIHYVHRTFIFPFRRRAGYKPMPVLIVLFSGAFNVANGYFQGYYLFTLAEPYPAQWLIDPRFLIGAFIFFTGFAINVHSDNTLFSLRKPGETGYKVSTSGLFRWVSAPNYLGEILEWTGWAFATWSLPGAAFAFWTAANLIPRAVSNHRWCRQNFPEYPNDRKILVPFVF